MRGDHQCGRRIDQQGVSIRCRACRGLCSDRCRRPWPVVDNDGQPLRPTDLFRQKAREHIKRAARRRRNDDFDRSSRLRPCGLGDQEPGLVRLGDPIAELSAPLWILTHKDLKDVPRVRAVSDFLTNRILAERALLEGHG